MVLRSPGGNGGLPCLGLLGFLSLCPFRGGSDARGVASAVLTSQGPPSLGAQRRCVPLSRAGTIPAAEEPAGWS